jgi:hypothetical protein
VGAGAGLAGDAGEGDTGLGVGSAGDVLSVDCGTQKRRSPVPLNAFASTTTVEMGGTFVAVEASYRGIAFATVTAPVASAPRPSTEAAPAATQLFVSMPLMIVGADESTRSRR